MGFAAAAAIAAAGIAFPPLLPAAASVAAVAEAMSVASGAAGLLKSGMVLAGMIDGSVPPEEAWHTVGESMVQFVASFFGGKVVERMGTATKAATKAEGNAFQGGAKLGTEAGGHVVADKATGADPQAPYAVLNPLLKRLEAMMGTGPERFPGQPYRAPHAPLRPHPRRQRCPVRRRAPQSGPRLGSPTRRARGSRSWPRPSALTSRAA